MITLIKLFFIFAAVVMVAGLLDRHIPGAAKVLFTVFGVGITGTFLAGIGTIGVGAKLFF